MDAAWWVGDDDRDQGCSDEPQTCDCPDCRMWRDNVEPREPDGDTFAVPYDPERMAHILRTLK